MKKTLLPEFLPAPIRGGAQSPRERVAERARLLLERLRGLGPAAGAAILSLQCSGSGYTVVDPIPPPPMQCTSEPIPFEGIHPGQVYETGTTLPRPVVMALVTSGYPPSNFVGYRIDAVRVTGGTLVSVEDLSQTGGGGRTEFQITIARDSGPPGTLFVDVDFACGPAAATKRYSIMFPTDPNGPITAVEIPLPVDGGTD